jgi:GH24 family phage-related lysozyme (muramidase)
MNAPFNRKTISDTVRSMIGRGFNQSEVKRLDRALDDSRDTEDLFDMDPVPCVPSVQDWQRIPESISPAGIALIKRFEGCARLREDGLVEAYPDPATGSDPWTIGWGATGTGIGPGTVWTQEQCDARLEQDLVRYSSEIAQAIGDRPTTQAQFDALVSFHYNTGAIGRATLTRKHLQEDFLGAADEFQRWNKAAGRVLKGLTRRRLTEAQLYSGKVV